MWPLARIRVMRPGNVVPDTLSPASQIPLTVRAGSWLKVVQADLALVPEFSKYNWNRIGWIVAVEAGAIVVLASFYLPGGQDLYSYYLPFANGCLDCGFVPHFAQVILWPLSLLPLRLVWPVWTALTVIGLLGLCRATRVNPAIVMLSFPAIGQFWLGQIDVIVAAGLVLSLLARNPYLRGAGIMLALVKPQLAGLAVLMLLFHERRREILKVLAIPLVAFIASLIVYGLTWPIDWFTNSMNNLPAHVWRLASTDVWPYGLVFLLTLLAFRSLRPRFEAALMVSALATPFFGVYSYVVFLIFRAPWWSLPLSYAWIAAYPIWGNAAMRLAWVLPVGLLGHLLLRDRIPAELRRRLGLPVEMR